LHLNDSTNSCQANRSVPREEKAAFERGLRALQPTFTHPLITQRQHVSGAGCDLRAALAQASQAVCERVQRQAPAPVLVPEAQLGGDDRHLRHARARRRRTPARAVGRMQEPNTAWLRRLAAAGATVEEAAGRVFATPQRRSSAAQHAGAASRPP